MVRKVKAFFKSSDRQVSLLFLAHNASANKHSFSLISTVKKRLSERFLNNSGQQSSFPYSASSPPHLLVSTGFPQQHTTMQSPVVQHSNSAASTPAQNSPSVQHHQLPEASTAQPLEGLLLLEDMLISPRFDTHSPHFRPFPSFTNQPAGAGAQDCDDTCGKRDQSRNKPARFSTTSLPDVDW